MRMIIHQMHSTVFWKWFNNLHLMALFLVLLSACNENHPMTGSGSETGDTPPALSQETGDWMEEEDPSRVFPGEERVEKTGEVPKDPATETQTIEFVEKSLHEPYVLNETIPQTQLPETFSVFDEISFCAQPLIREWSMRKEQERGPGGWVHFDEGLWREGAPERAVFFYLELCSVYEQEFIQS